MKKPGTIVLVLILLVTAVAIGLWMWSNEHPGFISEPYVPGHRESEPISCGRIVSMAPSITETLFALGLGADIVGVSRYCNYPPEAKRKTDIGGFFDPNYEAIIALSPSVVMVLPSHADQMAELLQLDLRLLEVNQTKLGDIQRSVSQLGEVCGVEKAAATLEAALSDVETRITRQVTGLPRPGVLIVVDREMGTGTIREVFVAGKNTFYDDLVRQAGGLNVYAGKLVEYPTLSAEGIVRVNPQVIVEIVPQLAQTDLSKEVVARDWDSLPELNAVRDRRIFIFTESYVAVPGPRYVLLLEQLARVIHPEVDWDGDE